MKTLEMAEQDDIAYVEAKGLSSIAEMRALPAEDLIPQGWTMPGGWPIVDGYVLPGDQVALYEQGAYNDVPVLIGYNSDEGLSFPAGRTAEEYVSNVRHRFGDYADVLLEAYPLTDGEVKRDRKSTRLNSSHVRISYAVFCLKKKKKK